MARSEEKKRATYVAGYVAGFVADARENGLADNYLRLLDEVLETAERRARETE